jgi:hypothetical protein
MPYAFLGVGFYAHAPQARDKATVSASGTIQKGDWVNLKPQNTSGQTLSATYPKSYSLVQPVFPLGLGIKWRINDKFDFAAEGGVRITPFDYLDDVGYTKYPDSTLPGISDFSNRVEEDYTARTGQSRIADFNAIMLSQGITATTSPSANGQVNYGFSKGSSRGGSGNWDTYVVTQFTLSYIINNKTKCPVIK